jgi:hypothetical protein
MANLQILISTTLMDADGDSKTFEIPALVADSVTLANLQTYVTGTQDIIDVATEAKIVSTSITLTFTNSETNKANAVAGSDVEEGALLSFAVTGSKYRNTLFLPAVIEAAKSGNDINLAQADLAPLVDRLIGAHNNVTAGNKFGMPNASAIAGKKRFRK